MKLSSKQQAALSAAAASEDGRVSAGCPKQGPTFAHQTLRSLERKGLLKLRHTLDHATLRCLRSVEYRFFLTEAGREAAKGC